MRLINLVLSALFFLIGVAITVLLCVIIIVFGVLTFYADAYTAVQVITWAMIVALIIPVFFMGMIAFYSFEYSAHLFDSTKPNPLAVS